MPSILEAWRRRVRRLKAWRELHKRSTALYGGRFGDRARVLEIEFEGRFQSILSGLKRLLHGLALSDGFGDVGKGHEEILAIRPDFVWVSHRVSYLSPSCFLMLS